MGARKVQTLLVEKPEGQVPLRRPRRTRWDNINIDFQEIGLRGVIWFALAQDRDKWRAVGSSVMELQVSKNEENSWKSS